MIQARQQLQSVEDQLLNWVAEAGIPVSEQRLQAGGYSYFNFCCFEREPHAAHISGHGRSSDRRKAALKAVGEYIERKAMLEYFAEPPAMEFGHLLRDGQLVRANLPDPSLRNSTGWAAHTDQTAASEASVNEAIERHLLMKSYLKFGWEGFNLVHRSTGTDMSLNFLTSKYTWNGKVAGLVTASSGEYLGISTGYCIGNISNVSDADFWEPAILEAIDKILTLKGQRIDLSTYGQSWMLAQTKKLLESPFDFTVLQLGSGEHEECETGDIFLKWFDLSKSWELSFPVFACYAWGPQLLSPFNPEQKPSAGLWTALQANGISAIPNRIPVI